MGFSSPNYTPPPAPPPAAAPPTLASSSVAANSASRLNAAGADGTIDTSAQGINPASVTTGKATLGGIS